MKKNLALKIVLIISIIGIAFSGYLSFSEIFAGVCGAEKLGMGSCTNVFQIPACVYGLIMYIVVFIFSLLGLVGRD